MRWTCTEGGAGFAVSGDTTCSHCPRGRWTKHNAGFDGEVHWTARSGTESTSDRVKCAELVRRLCARGFFTKGRQRDRVRCRVRRAHRPNDVSRCGPECTPCIAGGPVLARRRVEQAARSRADSICCGGDIKNKDGRGGCACNDSEEGGVLKSTRCPPG